MPQLHAVLSKAQELGFIGPAPLELAIRHAEGFATGVEAPPQRFVDLGSGAGLPGLVLLQIWPESEAVLLDANQRRTIFLEDAISELSLADRAQVVVQRAEEAGREPSLRHAHDLVVARGFGPPAVTSECASPFLRKGGALIVSEPPSTHNRWPAESLALLGLEPTRSWSSEFHYQLLTQSTECPTHYPRRTGIPAKRPLF